jgi:hypothetical protein
MIAFKDLNEILKITLEWERKLKDFYDVAEVALKSPESRSVVVLLRQKLEEKLAHLRAVDLAAFGRTEWVRYAPSYREEELIPIGRIGRHSPPQELFSHLLDYQRKLKNIYAAIAGSLVNRSQKELFESLALFKDEQIAETGRLAELYRSSRN